MSRPFLCQSCDEQKASLQKIPSKLIKGWSVTICATCIKHKYEPRSYIILAIRQHGVTDEAKKYITEKRYVGPEIAASDIV